MLTLTATTALRSGVVYTKTAVSDTDVRVTYDPNLIILCENTSGGSLTLTINQVTANVSNYGYADNEGGAIANGALKSFGPFTNNFRWKQSDGYLDMDFSGTHANMLIWAIILPVNLSETASK